MGYHIACETSTNSAVDRGRLEVGVLPMDDENLMLEKVANEEVPKSRKHWI